MDYDPYPTEGLFWLLKAGGYRQQDIAQALDVSQPLVSHWRQGRRPLTPPHFFALLELVCDPQTMAKIAQAVPPKHRDYAKLMWQLVSFHDRYNAWVVSYYDVIRKCIGELSAGTIGTPDTWDLVQIRTLVESLGRLVDHAPLIAEEVDPRIDQAIRAYNEAAAHQKKQKEGGNAAKNPDRDAAD
jgi:hypothetical protein